jgi:hypothetical protein
MPSLAFASSERGERGRCLHVLASWLAPDVLAGRKGSCVVLLVLLLPAMLLPATLLPSNDVPALDSMMLPDSE